MANNPTIVAASLSDQDLKNSIDKLVQHVDEATKKMASSMDSAVEQMKRKLGELGNVKIDFGSSSSGGGTKKVENDQKSLEEQVKRTTQTAKEQSMTFDQLAEGLKSALGVVRDFNTKRENMLPSRQDYLEYERALTRIVEYNERLKSSALSLAAANERGFSFNGKAFTKDFDEVDARLKRLNDFYKNWEKESNRTFKKDFVAAMSLPTSNIDEITQKLIRLKMIVEVMNKNGLLDEKQVAAANSEISSLLSKLENQVQLQRSINSDERNGIADIQKKEEAERQYSDEVKNAAQMLRERFALMKEFTIFSKSGLTVYDPLKQEANSIESQLFAYKERHKEANLTLEVEKAILQTEERITSQKNAQASQSNNGAKKTFAEYDDLRTAIAAVLGLEKEEVSIADKQNASFNALSMTLKHLQQAYLTLSASQRDSANADALIEKIHETQRAMKDIQNQMSRPISLDSAMALPEKTIDEMSYKIKMLRSYAQEVNTETKVGESTLLSISDKIEALNNKVKKVQKSTRQVSEEANNVKFDKLSKMPTDSIKQIGQKIKEVKGFIAELSKSPVIDEKNLMRAENLLNRLIKQAAKLNSEQGTEKNVNKALRERVNTLDDIARKMQRLQAIRQNLNINTQGAQIELINNKLRELRKQQDEILQRNQQIIASNNALGRSWNYMKNRLAFYFTVGASTQFIKNLIEVRSQYEMNERALGILINSAERGTQIFNELSQMALVSPYTLIELSNAAKQLTAYDIAANEVVDTTRRLADMASAVGVPMERLTYALGQIKAYGYLNSRDARMFANAGIPLVRELSKYYTELEGKMVSVGDVYDRMKKKAIDYNDVMSVVTKMTDEGGKFFDFQAKMADTLKVRLANLTLAWNNMLNDIGKSEQGVLTTGINLLKDFFLRWKDINRAVEDLVIVFGVLKAAQLAYYGMVLGTNKAIAIETVLGTKLSNVLRNLGTTMSTVLTSGATWWGLLAVAAGAAIVEVVRGNEAMKEFNKTLRENAKNTYNDLERFKEQYKELRESLYQTITDNNGKTIVTPQDINVDDAKKAWESVREQIELSSHASDKYIGGLLQIKNVSERLRQSFAVIDDIQSVSAAIKELGDGAIKLERDWSAWWNLWTLPDGTIGNLKDTHMWLGKIEEKYGSIEKARRAASGEDKAPLGIDKRYQDDAERWLENYENELKKFREDLESTKESVLNFINAQGWSGNVNKVNETFKQITDNLIQQNQLDPEKAYTLQIEMEEARSKAAKEAQYIRLQDLRSAYMAEKDSLHKEEIAKEYEKEAEIYNNWNLYNGRQKVEWERFTKYLKEQHLSEMTAMFRGMDAKQIESLNFQEGKYADWVKRMVTNYAKSHKISYDEAFNYLKNWVASANQWSIFIPLTISTDKNKTVMKTLEEADAAADKAWKDMQRLDKEIARLRKKGAKEVDENNITASEDDQRLTKALKERAAAEKDYNKAVSDGGESKKENAANTKAQKQAESELQKALKEELQLIDKVRSQYKKLTDAGVSRAVAMKTVTEQFGDSIKHINAVLGKNGLPKFDIKSFAGTDNPHEMMVMLKKQIDSAKKVKNIKPEEIKDLEIKYSEIKVDAEAYDATKIKKGLDNELGRLKDEYELAVELDANPELGNMFADMFDIDLDTLPRTAKEYADRYTKSLNKYFKQMGANIELPNMLNLTRNDMEAFTEQLGTGELQQAYFDLIQKGYEATQAARKKEATDAIKEYDKLLQKYSEYQYKLTQIEKNANQERKALVVQFGTEEQKERARKISAKLDFEKDPNSVEELKRQLMSLVDEVVGDDKVKIQLKVAIDKEAAEKSAKASFEEFQKSPEWVTATGNLAGLTDKALGGLIETIEEYKRKAKSLTPKQIKDINKALVNLEKERKKNNPFKLMSISVLEAKDRMATFDEEIKNVEDEMDKLSSNQSGDNLDETGEKILTLADRLRKLKKAREEAGDIDATEIVSNVNAMVASVGQAVQMVNSLLDVLNNGKWSEAQELMNDTFSVIEKGGQGAMIGAQIGQGYGAIIGAVVGVGMGLFEALGDNYDKKVNAKIKESEVVVKRLELAYVDLEHAIEKAYGTGEIGSKRLLASLKELELAELERQLALEQSRDNKHKDESKIADIQKQIKELRYEIEDSITEITNDLLGTEAGSFAENLVSSMIDAFKKGEDYMLVFEDKFDEMVDNMIMKSIVSRVVAQYIDQIWSNMDERIKIRSQAESDALAAAIKKRQELEAMDVYEYGESKGMAAYGMRRMDEVREKYQKMLDSEREAARVAEEIAQKNYDAAATMNDNDISSLISELAGIKPELGERLKEIIGQYYKFGETSEQELSALQQGIQSISETTAGAIEAYMNGVSQQVYLQSDYLRQIVDILMMQSALTDDAKVATLSQILLQLQSSYQTQEAIRGILEGWSSPNGLAVRVEMN